MKRNFGVALAKFNPICFVREVRKRVLLTILWVAAQTTAWSAPREIKPPPVGDTIKIEVMRGSAVPITLKAFERRGNPLAYEITREPRHGALTNFRQADKNKQGFASVVYQHGDDEGSTSDEFTFRARGLLGGGVSSPIKVMLEIVDAAPVFQITPSVDFTAIAGETDRQQIILANQGGGVISGRVSPKEPFGVEGNEIFRLGRGQITNIVLRFSPAHTGPVAPQRIFPAPAHPDVSIELRGRVEPPFLASAEPIELQEDGSRTGSIAITNLSSSTISVRLDTKSDEMPAIPSQKSIRANEAVAVPLGIGAEKAGGQFESGVSVSNEHHEQELFLVFPAVPAKLTPLTRELDFREESETTLVVTNKGGLEERFTLDLPSDVKALSKAGNFVVPAGKKMSVDLRWERRDEEEPGNASFVVRDERTAIPVLRPAALRVVTEALDFRNSSTAELVVQNRGDAEGEFRLQVPQGLRTDGKEERWEVPQRGQTIVTVRRISPDAAISGRQALVDCGSGGKTSVPIITTNLPQPGHDPDNAYPWQLNSHVRLVSSPEGILIEWLESRERWCGAILEKSDGDGWHIYEPKTEKKSWWEAFWAWFAKPRKEASDAMQEAKGFFEGRLEVPGEATAEPVQSVDSASNWQRVRISPADIEGPTTTWRITAKAGESAERRQASAEFRLDETQKTLRVAEKAAEPAPPGIARPPQGEQPLILRKIYDGRNLDLTIGLAGEKEARSFLVEQITGFSITDETSALGPDGNPLDRLVCRELPSSMATIQDTGTARSGQIELRTVRLLLKDLPRGQAFLCRLVPIKNGHRATPTTPFEVAGPPPIAVPWRFFLIAAVLFVILWLIRERMKNRGY